MTALQTMYSPFLPTFMQLPKWLSNIHGYLKCFPQFEQTKFPGRYRNGKRNDQGQLTQPTVQPVRSRLCATSTNCQYRTMVRLKRASTNWGMQKCLIRQRFLRWTAEARKFYRYFSFSSCHNLRPVLHLTLTSPKRPPIGVEWFLSAHTHNIVRMRWPEAKYTALNPFLVLHKDMCKI